MAKQLITKIDKAFLGRLCADAISNIERSIEKHPSFPSSIQDPINDDIEIAQGMMYSLKRQNDSGKGHADTIANEEEWEFKCAVIQGHGPMAYQELVDLITVWLRVGLHLDDYVAKEVQS
jgi:hypothetical protein